MPAEVETMAYNKQNGVPWHGLGVQLDDAADSEEMLFKSGLAWAVGSRKLYIAVNGKPTEVPDVRANVRLSDNKVLGIVSDRYTIVQNREAFEFTNEILGDARYETAGSLRGGRRVWVMARLNESSFVLGEEVVPYFAVTSTHDGSGRLEVAMTPTRIVCQNTLNIAMREAKRTWSVRHVGNVMKKAEAAKKTLKLVTEYMDVLEVKAEQLAAIPVDKDRWDSIVTSLLGVKPDDSGRKQANWNKRFEDLRNRIDAPDLANHKDNGWGVVNAIADFVDHGEPLRKTENGEERAWETVLDGHPLLDKAYDMVMALK